MSEHIPLFDLQQEIKFLEKEFELLSELCRNRNIKWTDHMCKDRFGQDTLHTYHRLNWLKNMFDHYIRTAKMEVTERQFKDFYRLG